MITKKCNECLNDFTTNNKQIKYCSDRCAAFGRYRSNLKRLGHSPDEILMMMRKKKSKNLIDRQMLDVKRELKGELGEEIKKFITELKRKCLYLDAVDAFKLVGFYSDVFGPTYFDKISIEEELFLCYKKLEKII